MMIIKVYCNYKVKISKSINDKCDMFTVMK